MRHIRYPKSVRAGWGLFIKRAEGYAWERVGFTFTSRLEAHKYQAKHHSSAAYRIRGLRYDPKPIVEGYRVFGTEKEAPSASN